MVEADMDAVLKIEFAAYSHPWTRGIFTDGLKSYEIWLMFDGEQQVGHGVIMSRAYALNGRECFLEVRSSNQSAYRLYERYGFNEIGRRRDYYPAVGGREDALVMACSLFE
jgi:ribosomal-protein-alanine N-acetyltransferase